MVEGRGRWRFAERHRGGKRTGARIESLNIKADWGLATYDVRNAGVMNVSYELPFGNGRQF